MFGQTDSLLPPTRSDLRLSCAELRTAVLPVVTFLTRSALLTGFPTHFAVQVRLTDRISDPLCCPGALLTGFPTHFAVQVRLTDPVEATVGPSDTCLDLQKP